VLSVVLFSGQAWAGSDQPQSAKDLELARAGDQALRAGDFKRAEAIYSALVKLAPSSANFESLAIAEAGVGNLDGAIGHFRTSIELGNESGDIHYNLALAFLQGDRREEGIAELKRALAKEPKFAAALYALGVTLLQSGRATEALEYLKQARRESPQDPAVWANLLQAEFVAGDRTAATVTAEQATETLPDNPQLAVTIAELCLRFHEAKEARKLLERVNEQLLPDSPPVKLLLARSCLLEREPVEALAALTGLPENVGAPGEVNFLRGSALAVTGKQEQALAALQAAVDAKPTSVQFLVGLAWAQQLQGLYPDALATLEKARQADPTSVIVPYRIAVTYFLLDRHQDVAKVCEDLIKNADRFAPAYFIRGMAELEQERFEAARSDLEKSVSLEPQSALFHRELGLVLLKLGELTESKKELDEALSIDPKQPRVYFWRAEVYERQGQEEEAIQNLQAAVAIDPAFVNAYRKLAQLYRKEGKTKESVEAMSKEKAFQDGQSKRDRDSFLIEMGYPLL